MATPVDASGLSQTALVALEYLVRHGRQKSVLLSRDGLERALSGAYPLFRYLFPNTDVLRAAIAELDRSGCLEAPLTSFDSRWAERLQRSVLQHIRLQCAATVDRIPLHQLGDVVASEAEDPNVGLLNERLKFIHECDLCAAAPFARQYQRALLEIGDSDDDKRTLLDWIAGLVGMQKMPNTPLVAYNLPTGWYESNDFVPNAQFRVALAVIRCNGDIDAQLQTARQLADLCKDTSLVFILVGDSSDTDPRLVDLKDKKHAVVVKDTDLKRVVLSNDRQRSLRECLFPQLPPSTLSPFRYVGPVTGDSFVGRKIELQRILNALTTSFTIMGARTIGKTSLLYTLRDQVNTGPARHDTVAVFVDATQNRQLLHFQMNLMQSLAREAGNKGVDIDWVHPGSEFFEDLSATLRKSRHQYLFLIDEIDNLIVDPRMAKFEEFVRTLSNTGCARFVLSGYRNLRERTEDRESFFFNLFEPITLSPLARMEALDLVRSQMGRIFVEFESDQVVEAILDHGSTFAAYLQRMCHLLLIRLDDRHRDRVIRLEDVHSVYEGEEFTSAITSAVTVSRERSAALLERLILYWAAAYEHETFTRRELLEGLNRYLYAPRLTELLKALQYLTATYVLGESGGRYHFCMPHLREKLRATEPDMQFTISSLAHEYHDLQ